MIKKRHLLTSLSTQIFVFGMLVFLLTGAATDQTVQCQIPSDFTITINGLDGLGGNGGSLDSDGDGIDDSQDSDDDGDGIDDSLEGSDGDGDLGDDNWFDDLYNYGDDSDGDGIPDIMDPDLHPEWQ